MTMVAVTIPPAGLVSAEGTVVVWLKQEGDLVQAGEAMCEIEFEKAAVTVPAPVSGRLVAILAPVAAAVVATTVVARIETAPDVPTPAPAAAHAPAPERLLASPAARQLAAELGVDLRQVPATGPEGRRTLADVRAAAGVPAGAAVPPDNTPAAPPDYTPAAPPDNTDEAPSAMRRAIARRLAVSARIPQFAATRTIPLDALLARQAALDPTIMAAAGLRLTVTHLILHAGVQALRLVPQLNVSWLGDAEDPDARIRRHRQIHLGILVATAAGGLVTPVLRNAADLSLVELAARVDPLVAAARQGGLTAADLTGSTFTVSNLGAEGPDRFQALLNPPEAGILAVGRVRRAPVVLADTVAVAPVADFTLTVDHRAVDGRVAAQFLAALAELLQAAHEPPGSQES